MTIELKNTYPPNQPRIYHRFTKSSITAAQHAVEYYMVSLFEDANLAAIHANRITVRPSDIQFVQKIRKS